MAIKYGTKEWAAALEKELKGSKAYLDAIKGWEGDLYLIAEPEGKMEKPAILYLDVWRGEVRTVTFVADEKEKSPEFVLRGPVSVWRKIAEGTLDAMIAMGTRKLVLEKGSMFKIMKSPKASPELVNAIKKIATEWPV